MGRRTGRLQRIRRSCRGVAPDAALVDVHLQPLAFARRLLRRLLRRQWLLLRRRQQQRLRRLRLRRLRGPGRCDILGAPIRCGRGYGTLLRRLVAS